MTIRETRFAALGYCNPAPRYWRIVDVSTGAVIGPHYATKAELMGDLHRFATESGFIDAPHVQLPPDSHPGWERLEAAINAAHADDCAMRIVSAAECTCGKADRLAAIEQQDGERWDGLS